MYTLLRTQNLPENLQNFPKLSSKSVDKHKHVYTYNPTKSAITGCGWKREKEE